MDAHRLKLNEMQGQQDSFDKQMASAVLAASSQQASFDTQMARAVKDASAKQAGFDTQMATAVLAASNQQRNLHSHMARAAPSDMKGAYDRLAHDKVFPPQGQSLEQQPPPPRSSTGPIDISGVSRCSIDSSAPRRRATSFSFSASEHSSFVRSPSLAVTDHSQLSKHHGCVTIFFSDLIGFSTWAHELPPDTIMATLDDLYTRLDNIILEEMPGVYKVTDVCSHLVICVRLASAVSMHGSWSGWEIPPRSTIFTMWQPAFRPRRWNSHLVEPDPHHNECEPAPPSPPSRWRPSVTPTWPSPTWWSRTRTMLPRWCALP